MFNILTKPELITKWRGVYNANEISRIALEDRISSSAVETGYYELTELRKLIAANELIAKLLSELDMLDVSEKLVFRADVSSRNGYTKEMFYGKWDAVRLELRAYVERLEAEIEDVQRKDPVEWDEVERLDNIRTDCYAEIDVLSRITFDVEVMNDGYL